MTTISATQARTKLYDLLDEVSQTGERVGITKKGETKAVEATLDVMSDTKLVRGIKKGMEDIKAGRLVEWKDVKKKFGM